MTTSARIPEGVPQEIAERKLTIRQLADLWGWTPTLLSRMVRRNEIPHLRIGKHVYFEARELEAWLANMRHASPVRREASVLRPMRHNLFRE